MNDPALSMLNGCSLAIEIQDGPRCYQFQGTGSYLRDPDLGAVLRVSADAAAGGLVLLLQEAAWRGEIERAASSDCDYRIRLSHGEAPRTTSMMRTASRHSHAGSVVT